MSAKNNFAITAQERGIWYIGVKAVREAGLAPNSNVFVSYNNGSVTISDNPPSHRDSISLTVEKRGSIRVRKHMLKEKLSAKFDGRKKPVATVSKGRINIVLS